MKKSWTAKDAKKRHGRGKMGKSNVEAALKDSINRVVNGS